MRFLVIFLIAGFLVLPATAAEWRWEKLPAIPDREGFAGMFAGVSGDTLLAAGGANFPDKKPWEGGKKVWDDRVFALDRPDGKWATIGKLPRPLGYGVSVSHRGGVVCVGGSNADGHYADCFRLEVQSGKLVTTSLPRLPEPIANSCGTLVGDTLYLAGGLSRPDAEKTLKVFLALDLAAKEPKWRELEPWPGRARMLSVPAEFDGAFWLISGTDLIARKGGLPVRQYLTDAYRYDPGNGWKRVADLPRAVVAAPSPTVAGASGPVVLGGDDGNDVATPPDRHPGFSKIVLRYDAKADRWIEDGKLVAPRCTVPLVLWKKSWVIPCGEVRPGVRSPEVWSVTP
jgi:N-acetylneuraminic acid mutarotase